MQVAIRAMVTKGAKKIIGFTAKMPDADMLTEKHYAAIEKSLKAKFRGAEVYLIEARIEKAE